MTSHGKVYILILMLQQRDYKSVGVSDLPRVTQLSEVAPRDAMLHNSVNGAHGDGFVWRMVVLAAEIGMCDF